MGESLKLTAIQYTPSLPKESSVKFHFNNELIIEGTVNYTLTRDEYYIQIHGYNNDEVFRRLGITKPNKWVNNIVDYTTIGNWPQVKSREDLKKVLDALLKYGNKASKNEVSNNIIKINKQPKVKLNFKL